MATARTSTNASTDVYTNIDARAKSTSTSVSGRPDSCTPDDDEDEPVIAGPFALFEGSFIIEFLQPRASRNASVLMRATYKHDHPLCKRGKDHAQHRIAAASILLYITDPYQALLLFLSAPDLLTTMQSPPLHLHFQQSESFAVLSGQIGTVSSYSATDTIHTPVTTGVSHPYEIRPWVPHTFFPSPDATEDTVILAWAHPGDNGRDDQMDRLFFQSLLMYVSDVAEGKEKLSLLQIMLIQHASSTALVMFPKAWFLGPLRWWIPWKFQALCATVAAWLGMKPLLAKYMSATEWDEVQERIGGGDKKSV